MSNISIEGNKNIANSGIISGDLIVNNTSINLDNIPQLYKLLTMEKDKEIEASLVNLTEATKVLAEAINKFAQARENDSLANINYSKVLLEDREIIRVLMSKLK